MDREERVVLEQFKSKVWQMAHKYSKTETIQTANALLKVHESVKEALEIK